MPEQSNTDLLLTELRKAIRVEAGDYIVVLDITKMTFIQLQAVARVGEELWRQNIRLHTIETSDPSAIRFVRVETPETIQVEEK